MSQWLGTASGDVRIWTGVVIKPVWTLFDNVLGDVSNFSYHVLLKLFG
ncbi:hypothetical protein HSB1_18620 [Halogranum salarium B-1]|uniref:Uncharacterized protein n=1 Tax=Halogranum salarium B-1 TaxID=1210908 RepID=J3JG00_9EURY|nr:hypothetical protein HSB1_18620 [Halogranum salarium B-1]